MDTGLANLTIKEEYRTGFNDLVKEFYQPCLNLATRYSRAVGYFSSTVFLLIGPEFIKFAQKGGKFRLVCSPFLSSLDIKALELGYSSYMSEKDVCDQVLNSIDQLISNEQTIKNTEALATLIMSGTMEVKLAFNKKGNGLYHEKMGIIEDNSNAFVVFKGSVNETWKGWHNQGNYESMDVFCSWVEGRDERIVESSIKYFDDLWSNNVDSIEVINFPAVAKEKLKSIAKNNINDIDPSDLNDFFKLEKNKNNTKNNNNWTPYPHQSQAIEAWKKQDKRGVLEHATGSGKTFTALIALDEHLGKDGVALVLVPDKLLHKQWALEIKKHLKDVFVLKVGCGHNKWRKSNTLNITSRKGEELGRRIILATMPTARLAEFRQSICSGDHLMVVADEVHEIGSKENSKILLLDTGSRLGLSATPRRYGDPVGTDKILKYFGSIVQPPFTLVDAINSGRLVKYEYLPTVIHLTAEESNAWEKASLAISREFAKSKRDDDGKPMLSPRLQNMLIQRSRIAKKAEGKITYTLKVIKENYKDGESWLIYCEDQYQLGEVMEILQSSGYNPDEYHTNMKGDQVASLASFKNFGGIMVSIRCLDQGVDIPKISHAIILASSQNPRQFIQRRGRVLRTSEGKFKATIYDAIVMPLDLKNEPGQLSLLKSELQRSIQFSKTAMNLNPAHKLIELAIELGIDPEEFGLLDTDGIEDSGETNDK